MCYHPMRIKATSEFGAKFQYVPCGKCEECRNTSRSAWSWRLQAELEYRQSIGWQSGFMTLTYAPDNLPKMDTRLFKMYEEKDFPCFDRVQVRDYIHAVRKYLHRHYGVRQLVYMVCSEYGHKGRPHYHLVVSWPPAQCKDKTYLGNSRELDDVTMHRILKDNWIDKGFVFPRYCQGGFDGQYYHKPFKLNDVVSFAAKYAAKYCCKDMNFANELSHRIMLDDDDMDEELKLCLKNSSPFHMQSRSLGWSLVAQMSDDKKMHLLKEGYVFLADDSALKYDQAPLYIRNKLFFNPAYIIDPKDGHRLVRRERSDFFKRNYREIYSRKVDYYDNLISRICDSDFWQYRHDGSPFFTPEKARFFADFVREALESSSISKRELAEGQVSYYGVDYGCCCNVDPCEQWFARYTDYWYYVDADTGELKTDWQKVDGKRLPLSSGNDFDPPLFEGHRVLIDFNKWLAVQVFWNRVFSTLVYTNNWYRYDRDEAEVLDNYRSYLDKTMDDYQDYKFFDVLHIKAG